MDDNEVEVRVYIRDDTAAGAAQARAGAKRAGEQAGRQWGQGFTKARDERLRDSQGRFVSASDPEGAGEESGQRFGRGFLSKFKASMSGGGGGGVAGLATKLIGQFTGAFELSAKTLATGFSYQFTTSVAAGLASGAAKMAHGLAAIGALLPAIAATGALAFGTIKLAVAGVGDTLTAGLTGDTKKFEEGLKGLAPAARDFAHEVVGMRSQLDALKNTVQQNFFTEFANETSRLGKIYLPTLREQLGATATSFGFAVQDAAGFLQTPKAILMVRGALANMGETITNVTQGVGGLVQGFVPLVAVGSTFLPRLTAGIGDASNRFGAFMTRIAATGQLADFIQGGIDKLQSLGRTAERVWNIAKNVWSIFKQLGGFGSVLSGLGIKSGGLLTQFEELTDRAAKFFSTSAGGKAMADAVRTIRELLNASMGMFAKLAGIIAPFAPQIAEFATAVENLLTGIVDAAAPVLEVFLGKILPAITLLVNYVSEHTPVIQGLLIGLFAAWVAGSGAAAISTIIAAAPFIALGLVIAGLAAIVITNFDTIKRWISNVWNWVHDHWPMLAAIFIGPVAFAIPWIMDHWRGLLEFVKRLPAAIKAGAGGMWNPLLSGLVSVVSGIEGQIRRILKLVHLLPGQGGSTVNLSGYGGGYVPGIGGGGAGGGGGSGGLQRRAHGGIGGGLRELSERGRELMKIPGGGPHGTLVNVPPGSTVYPSGQSDRMLADAAAGSGSTGTVTVIIDASALLPGLRREVQVKHGGNVQVALGQG